MCNRSNSLNEVILVGAMALGGWTGWASDEVSFALTFADRPLPDLRLSHPVSHTVPGSVERSSHG